MKSPIQIAVLALLGLLTLLSSAGCEQIQVVADNVRLLSFRYAFYPSQTDADSLRVRIGDISVLEQGNLFLLDEPNVSNDLNHTRIFTSSSGLSTLRIYRFNPRSAYDTVATGLEITLRDNLTEGTVYQPAAANVYVGDRSDDTQLFGRYGDSFFELEITRFDTVNRVIAGNFHGVLRNQDDPFGAEVLVIQEGTFRQTYQLRN